MECLKCKKPMEPADACYRCGALVIREDPQPSPSDGLDGYNALLADYRKLRNAAEHIRHWHDTNDDGMIVSGSHVRELWKALAETKAL